MSISRSSATSTFVFPFSIIDTAFSLKSTLYAIITQIAYYTFIIYFGKYYSILYIDEAGVDNRLYREYGRAPRGKKIYADIPGRKRERISIVAGWIGKRFIAPMTFKGGCDKEVFNTCLEKMLLPTWYNYSYG